MNSKRLPPVLLASLIMLAAGCTGTRQWNVELQPNEARAGLEADDVVLVMRRAGFTDQQILDLGPRVRNALAVAGALKITADNTVEAIFAVDSGLLYGVSRRHGSFIYDLTDRSFTRR